MFKSAIAITNVDEVSKRASRDEEKLGISMIDPITYVTDMIEKIADETGVLSSVVVSPEGKMGIRFHATVNMRKLAELRVFRGE